MYGEASNNVAQALQNKEVFLWLSYESIFCPKDAIFDSLGGRATILAMLPLLYTYMYWPIMFDPTRHVAKNP
jgi:hypothetical protein